MFLNAAGEAALLGTRPVTFRRRPGSQATDRCRVATALEALASECLRAADAVEGGGLAADALAMLAELVAEARAALAERLPPRADRPAAAR